MSDIDFSQNSVKDFSDDLWERNKEAVLSRLSEKNESLALYREKIASEKSSLEQEVESIEEENHSLTKKIKELEYKLMDKNSELKKISLKLNDSKKKLVVPITEENGLLSEIRFFESEKAALYETYNGSANVLSQNITELGVTIKDIEFVKGEVVTLVSKLNMMEDEIPGKYNETDHLEEKISQASKAIDDFYSRMKEIERNVKVQYYKKGE